MDKYEYKVRADEIHDLIYEGEFARAVEIADTIDWRRVKSIKTLCTISDLYKANRRYQESKEILLMAYERYPGGRLIVYSLCELSIKLEEYVQAIEYYKEYVQLAPKDTNRYILQYKLYEAQDVSLEERIEVLEEFKRKDYREKWAYELAYLYHRIGLSSKCIDECDEIIVTFGEGKYVIKAMELKVLHQPLSPSEQAKYDSWMRERDEYIAENSAGSNVSMNTNSDVSASTDDEDLKGAPTTEMPQDIDIQVKTVDVGQYNTINLQEALAESMKDIWTGEEASESVIEPSTPEANVDDSTFFGTGPMAGPMYVNDADTFNVDTWEQTGELPLQEPAAEETKAEPQVEAVDIPVSSGMHEYRITPPGENVLSEETKRIPTEEVVNYIEAHKFVEEAMQDTASMAQTQQAIEKIVEQDPVNMSIEDSSSAYDGMLAQESDGQISLAIPDSEQVEKQITGQLSIEDIMAGWEQAKKENEEKRRREVKLRILQHTGSLFDEFDEDTRAGLLEQLEKAFRDAIDKEAKGGNVDSEELNQKINAEAKRAVEYLARDGMVDEEVEEEPAETEEEKDAVEETVGTEEAAEASESENTEEAADAEAEDAEEYPELEEDSEEVKAVMQALAEDEEDADENAETGEESADGEKARVLSEEEEEFFSPYLTRKSTKRQITAALDNMSMASYTGNVIVTGEEGVGTIDLAKRLIKHIQLTDANFLGQVAKISGKSLNAKDLSEVLGQIKGGALIIETARGMKKSTIENLLKLLEKEDLGILVILEDTAEGMERILKAIPNLANAFNVRIDLRALDDEALVRYAREYALTQEFSIDEFGILQLHTRIEEMQTSDHQVTVADVRDLVDDAIYYAEKKTPAHFFDIIMHKRYDSQDMIILREKDFMHY